MFLWAGSWDWVPFRKQLYNLALQYHQSKNFNPFTPEIQPQMAVWKKRYIIKQF